MDPGRSEMERSGSLHVAMTEANCYNLIKKLSVNARNRRTYSGQVRQARKSTGKDPKRVQQYAFYRRLNRKP